MCLTVFYELKASKQYKKKSLSEHKLVSSQCEYDFDWKSRKDDAARSPIYPLIHK